MSIPFLNILKIINKLINVDIPKLLLQIQLKNCIGNIQKNKYLIGIAGYLEMINYLSYLRFQASNTFSMVWKFLLFSNPKPCKLNIE